MLNLKKILLITLSTSLVTTLLTCDKTDAASFNKILTKTVKSANIYKQGSVRIGQHISTENLIPDGTYYCGSGYGSKQNKGVVKKYQIYIEKPSLLRLHFVNDSPNMTLFHDLYDSDGNKLNNNIGVSRGEARGYAYIVHPGYYKLEVGGNPAFNADISYKVKAIAEVINGASYPNNRRSDSAIQVAFDSSVRGYFSHDKNRPSAVDLHYYAINLDRPREVTLIYNLDTDIGGCTVELVDCDELLVGDRRVISYQSSNKLSYTLNPGIYYIKIKCDDRKGAIYNFSVR